MRIHIQTITDGIPARLGDLIDLENGKMGIVSGEEWMGDSQKITVLELADIPAQVPPQTQIL